MSVAYVVLAHKAPGQLARLVCRLTSGPDHVVVHVDGRQSIEPFVGALAGVADDKVTLLVDERVDCYWGDYSLVRAAIIGCREALRVAPDASHVVLLSGQCYPLRGTVEIDEFFAGHEGASFIFRSVQAGPKDPDRTGNVAWSWDGAMHRLARFHVRVGERRFALPNKFVPWWPMRSMPSGLSPAQGSQWWGLSREAVTYLLDFLQDRPDVVRFFRHVEIPDEFLVQMVLDASPLRSTLVQDDLHYIEWEREHPRTLTVADLPALRRSSKLFGRKFDEAVDYQVLDDLDSRA